MGEDEEGVVSDMSKADVIPEARAAASEIITKRTVWIDPRAGRLRYSEEEMALIISDAMHARDAQVEELVEAARDAVRFLGDAEGLEPWYRTVTSKIERLRSALLPLSKCPNRPPPEDTAMPAAPEPSKPLEECARDFLRDTFNVQWKNADPRIGMSREDREIAVMCAFVQSLREPAQPPITVEELAAKLYDAAGVKLAYQETLALATALLSDPNLKGRTL